MDSLLDLDRQLEAHPQATVIHTDEDLTEFMCDMGVKWRAEHDLPPVNRKTAGELYATIKKTEEMEYQFL